MSEERELSDQQKSLPQALAESSYDVVMVVSPGRWSVWGTTSTWLTATVRSLAPDLLHEVSKSSYRLTEAGRACVTKGAP